MSATGGIVYHSRALRHRNAWHEPRRKISQKLLEWHHPENKLILLGSSAGYLIETEFLKSLHRDSTAYDLDPLGLWLLKQRSPIRTKIQNIFGQEELDLNFLSQILSEHQGSDFVFCNILGQLSVGYKEPKQGWESFWTELISLLSDHRWFSFHDRLSGQFKLKNKLPTEYHDNASLCEYIDSKLLYDHRTESFAKHIGKSEYVDWKLTPSKVHLLELVHS